MFCFFQLNRTVTFPSVRILWQVIDLFKAWMSISTPHTFLIISIDIFSRSIFSVHCQNIFLQWGNSSISLESQSSKASIRLLSIKKYTERYNKIFPCKSSISNDKQAVLYYLKYTPTVKIYRSIEKRRKNQCLSFAFQKDEQQFTNINWNCISW